jgi:hypothetical protein
MHVPTTWSCVSCCSSPRISACTNSCCLPFYNNSRDKPPDTIFSAQTLARTRSGCQALQRPIRASPFVFPPKRRWQSLTRCCTAGHGRTGIGIVFYAAVIPIHTAKIEFTGVGIASVCNFAPRVPRKTLTAFRESETPGRPSTGFSRLCPRPATRRVLPAPCTEVPFFRHFSVMAGGIKTYAFEPRKKLSGWPGWPNTGCVLAVHCPRSSPGGHKI